MFDFGHTREEQVITLDGVHPQSTAIATLSFKLAVHNAEFHKRIIKPSAKTRRGKTSLQEDALI